MDYYGLMVFDLSRLRRWTIMDYYGLYKNGLDYYGLFWTNMDYYGLLPSGYLT